MTETDDMDIVAAEYVLGTLDAGERATVAMRRVVDRGLDGAISAWEIRLAPLNDAIVGVAPPVAVKAAVLAELFAPGAEGGAPLATATILALKRRVAVWRGAALAASAMAASLVGLVVYREGYRDQPAPSSYVAVLQKDAQSPAFLMTVDLVSRTFTVRPVAAKPQAGKSYELWLVHDKLGAPKSLGVVGDRPYSQSPRLAAYDPGEIEGATYAVSLEPAGGSPTGAPTGPVLFAGKLVQAQP